MHIQSVSISNVRCFESLQWDLPSRNLKGWHVIIGDNGAGKSSFLRCIALALCGPREVLGLRESWETWPRKQRDSKASFIKLSFDDSQTWDKWEKKGRTVSNFYLSCGFYFKKQANGETTLVASKPKFDPARHVWSKKPGWFSASYGPFRRFTGGDAEKKSVFYTHSILGRHLSVFGENIALTESLEWLSQLRFEELDGDQKSGQLLKNIREFINQSGFLPHNVRFEEVSSKAVIFLNPEGMQIDVTRLSDGFRSVLSMTFELIRQMTACYGTADIFQTQDDGTVTVKAPGVVLIDEIDAHLHPTWQRKIGFWLTGHFPELQFIVTTHSPLICQAAEKGTIFRLPTPGSEQSEAGFVNGLTRERLINGDVLDAYGTELFGRDVDRPDTAKKMLQELAQLNQKESMKGLTESEKARQIELKKTYSAHILPSF